MKTETYTLDPITILVEKFAWIFWTVLWASLAFGLGQTDLEYSTRGVYEIPEIITILVTTIMWLSVILQSLKQAFYVYPKPVITRLGNWLLLGSSTIFTFRITWILFIHDYIVHISPIILIGATLMGIGLSLNALSGIIYADKIHYDLKIKGQQNVQ